MGNWKTKKRCVSQQVSTVHLESRVLHFHLLSHKTISSRRKTQPILPKSPILTNTLIWIRSSTFFSISSAAHSTFIRLRGRRKTSSSHSNSGRLPLNQIRSTHTDSGRFQLSWICSRARSSRGSYDENTRKACKIQALENKEQRCSLYLQLCEECATTIQARNDLNTENRLWIATVFWPLIIPVRAKWWLLL